LKKVLNRLACFLLSSCVCVSATPLFAKADTQLVSKTATVTFNESQQQNQSQTVNLPNLVSVDSATVDNGNVSFTQNGTNLTVNVSGGSVKRTYTPSKAATSTSDQYLNTSFSATKSYNDGTYSGSLSQSGSPYVVSGSYTPATTHYYGGDAAGANGSLYKDVTFWDWCYWNGSSMNYQYVTNNDVNQDPNNYHLSDNGVNISVPVYASTNLSTVYTNAYHDPWDYCAAGNTYNTAIYVWRLYYYGSHTWPAQDNRTWRQNYSGTVFAPAQNYYSYTVTVNYKAQYTRPVLTVTADNANNQINLSWNMSDTSQTYKYSIFRKSSADSSFQLISSTLNGLSWTDANGKDMATASAPSISGVTHTDGVSQFTVNYSSTDNGTAYQYYVEATGQSDGTKIQSPMVSATITTGIKGYSIVVDNSPSTVPNGSVTTTATNYSFPKPVCNGFYIHIASVDYAGNVSAITHYHVDDFISVTHPVSIAYTIDPNSVTPFTAPDIPIINNSSIPIKVSVQSLKSVSGGSVTLNDVAASKYADWSRLSLSQTESDMALGVGIRETSTSSETWAVINQTTQVFATDITGKTLLGTLNPNGAKGNLKLTMQCGLAWDKACTATHSLSLLFELTDS
jgi:hypothetical protein